MLTQNDLKRVLRYDEQSGNLYWLTHGRGRKVHQPAGSVGSHGYRQIGIDGRQYLAHRLIWLFIHGAFPAFEIDHWDGDKTNNRIANLREATRSQNKCNTRLRSDNSSGIKGVIFDSARGRWAAQIGGGKGHQFLGRYDTREEAAAAYASAAVSRFGAFARPLN